MRCPKCQHNKSSVIDSRQAEDGNTIRRRRECDSCHARFTTFERVEEVPLLVVKKDGTREQFSRDKIFKMPSPELSKTFAVTMMERLIVMSLGI